MRLVIEESDFRSLSTELQMELLKRFAGIDLRPAPPPKPSRARWRVPVDLSHDLAMKLLHGMPEEHKRRLRLFARDDGRVRMSELLSTMGNKDVRALSHFEGAVTRRLRRIMDDEEKKAHLIGWDYESTRWDKDSSTIVDGDYYVTPRTARVLMEYFGEA